MTNYRKIEDRKLLEMMGKGGKSAQAAFTELYDRYNASVYAYCFKILGNRDEAEDVFQDVFYKFYNNASANSGKGTAKGFLITIARNLCLNRKRDNKSTVSIEDFEYMFKTSQSYETKEMAELVRMAVDLLEHKYKEPLVLKVYNDLDYAEISEMLGLNPATVRSRVFRAKQKIKDILKPYFKESQSKKRTNK